MKATGGTRTRMPRSKSQVLQQRVAQAGAQLGVLAGAPRAAIQFVTGDEDAQPLFDVGHVQRNIDVHVEVGLQAVVAIEHFEAGADAEGRGRHGSQWLVAGGECSGRCLDHALLPGVEHIVRVIETLPEVQREGRSGVLLADLLGGAFGRMVALRAARSGGIFHHRLCNRSGFARHHCCRLSR